VASVEIAPILQAGPRWHCVETLPRRELLVIFEMHVLGLETFLPLYLPRPDAVLEPAFPGYVLVRFAVGDPAWRRIHSRPGVLRLLQHDAERPMVVSDGEVERLVRRYGADGEATVAAARAEWQPMVPGSMVAVVLGPFAGFAGRVVQDAGARVRIAVDCFGQATECELPRVAVCA
jgi:transcription antitermination factor NusG